MEKTRNKILILGLILTFLVSVEGGIASQSKSPKPPTQPMVLKDFETKTISGYRQWIRVTTQPHRIRVPIYTG